MSTTAAPSLLRHRLDGSYAVDDWGLDPDLVRLLAPAFRARWSIDTRGAERLPADGPVLLVHNRRLGLSEPFVVARGIGLATGRFVRAAGLPDIAPLGPFLRRLGGVLDRTDEVAGLLRAGEVVALPVGCDRRAHRAGPLRPDALVAAVATGVPVHPVTAIGHELGRSWQVVVGEPVVMEAGVGPLAVTARAEAVQAAVQALLDASHAGQR